MMLSKYIKHQQKIYKLKVVHKTCKKVIKNVNIQKSFWWQ